MDDLSPINPLQMPQINCIVFHNLTFEEKKLWRTLCRDFYEATLCEWNKGTVVVINEKNPKGAILNQPEPKDDDPEKVPDEARMKTAPILNLRFLNSLQEFPPYDDIRLTTYRRDCDPASNILTFLERNASSLSSLSLDARFRQDRLEEFLKLLLFKWCTKLEELEIKLNNTVDSKEDQIFLWNKPSVAEGNDEEMTPHNHHPMIAEQLTTLSIHFPDRFCESAKKEILICKNVLAILPNITRFKLAGEFLQRMIIALAGDIPKPSKDENGTVVSSFKPKLQELEIDANCIDLRELLRGVFRLLRVYVKKVNPSIRKFRLLNYNSSGLCSAPYWFHQFVSDCRFSLTHLELRFKYLCPSNPSFAWFSDITGIEFSSLRELIVIDSTDNIYQPIIEGGRIFDPVKFDFRALRGMPNLKIFRCFSKLDRGVNGYLIGNSPVAENIVLSATDLEFRKNIRGGALDGEAEGEQDFNWVEQVSTRNIGIDLSCQKKEDWKSADPTFFVLKELEEFTFFLEQRIFDRDALRQLAKWMPKIKCLGIAVNKETFPVIFDAWRGRGGEKSRLEKVVVISLAGVTPEFIKNTIIEKSAENVSVEIAENYEQCFKMFNTKIF